MEERRGLNVTELRADVHRHSRGGVTGRSPDALLLNLLITGAAEEEKNTLALEALQTNADERNVYRRKQADSNTTTTTTTTGAI